MNILFIVPPPYLPNKLHRIRSYNLIKVLSKNHNIHLLAVTTEKRVSPEFGKLKKQCSSVTIVNVPFYTGIHNIIMFPHLPYEVAFCENDNIRNLVSKIIRDKNIDLVYLKRIRSEVYFDRSTINVPTILDSTDAMSLFYNRLASYSHFPKKQFYILESMKYKKFEKNVSKFHKHWIVCSETDKEYLLEHVNGKISVIPNITEPKTVKRNTGKKSLLFQGLMDKPVNIDAVTYFINMIFPRILEKHPNCLLTILGPNPPKQIKNLASKNIKVKGFVKNTDSIYRDTTISICPMRIGSGTRNKILNAWASGIPVVSTQLGAEGLHASHNKNILIADIPIQFANSVNDLLSNTTKRKRLAKNAMKTLQTYYLERSVQKKLEQIISDATK